MPPIIGVTACRSLADYLESVKRAGGDPRVLDGAAGPSRGALDGVHALLLTGGPDVDPARYGEERHTTVSSVDPQRDQFEIDVINEAIERKLPIFGICRGLQILNVTLHGSLFQDLRRWRAAGVAYFRTQMTRALDLMGIPVPPRM